MRMMVYRGTGGLKVVGDGFGRTFADGAFVDFDDIAGQIVREVETPNPDGPPTVKKKKSTVTWEEAIGEKYAHLFEPTTKKAATSTKAAR